jgi:hypothetical protein
MCHYLADQIRDVRKPKMMAAPLGGQLSHHSVGTAELENKKSDMTSEWPRPAYFTIESRNTLT